MNVKISDKTLVVDGRVTYLFQKENGVSFYYGPVLVNFSRNGKTRTIQLSKEIAGRIVSDVQISTSREFSAQMIGYDVSVRDDDDGLHISIVEA